MVNKTSTSTELKTGAKAPGLEGVGARGRTMVRQARSVPLRDGARPSAQQSTGRTGFDARGRWGASRPHAGALPIGRNRHPGQVSRCGDELARTALYEAAHTLLVRSRK